MVCNLLLGIFVIIILILIMMWLQVVIGLVFVLLDICLCQKCLLVYLQVMVKFDVGGYVYDCQVLDVLFVQIDQELGMIEIQECLLGIVGCCYLGYFYEVYILDFGGCIIEYFKKGYLLLLMFEWVCVLVMYLLYVFIEVYVIWMVVVSEFGQIVIIEGMV